MHAYALYARDAFSRGILPPAVVRRARRRPFSVEGSAASRDVDDFVHGDGGDVCVMQ